MIQASRGLREICSEDCFNPILDVLNVIIFGLKCKKKKKIIFYGWKEKYWIWYGTDVLRTKFNYKPTMWQLIRSCTCIF